MPWSPIVVAPNSNPDRFSITQLNVGVQVWLNAAVYRRQPRYIQHFTACPRALYSPTCTPWDVPIAPNDTCRQATVWPADPGDASASDAAVDRYVDRSRGSKAKCPVMPGVNASLANSTVFESDIPALLEVTASGAVQQNAQRTTHDTVYTSREAGLENRWHQVVTVTYPPGTVAVLPIEGAALTRLGYP